MRVNLTDAIDSRWPRHGRGGLLAFTALLLALLALTGCPKPQPQESAASTAPGTPEPEVPPYEEPPSDQELKNPVVDTSALGLEQFVNDVLNDINDVWGTMFDENGRKYSNPQLTLFADEIDGVCDFERPASGTFYCSTDSTLYVDTAYLSDLRGRTDAPGDLAAAYVIAHDLGHHVQNVLGYTAEVEQMRSALNDERSAELTLRYELQADFFAGVWAHHAGLLPAEVTRESAEAMLNAVATVGEGLPQIEDEGTTGFAPDRLDQGTAEQRLHWFMRGFETGDISYGTTFKDEL